jgi:hypothetical protein
MKRNYCSYNVTIMVPSHCCLFNKKVSWAQKNSPDGKLPTWDVIGKKDARSRVKYFVGAGRVRRTSHKKTMTTQKSTISNVE